MGGIFIGLALFYQFNQNKKKKSKLPNTESSQQNAENLVVENQGKKTEPLSDDKQIWLERLESVTLELLPDFNLKVDVLAREMNMGRTLFFTKVKDLTGLTPKQYIQERRLQLSKHYLETGQKTSVKSTAYAVGVKDVKYFSRIFRKRFNKLPSNFLESK